jgi:hypothetical protein
MSGTNKHYLRVFRANPVVDGEGRWTVEGESLVVSVGVPRRVLEEMVSRLKEDEVVARNGR